MIDLDEDTYIEFSSTKKRVGGKKKLINPRFVKKNEPFKEKSKPNYYIMFYNFLDLIKNMEQYEKKKLEMKIKHKKEREELEKELEMIIKKKREELERKQANEINELDYKLFKEIKEWENKGSKKKK